MAVSVRENQELGNILNFFPKDKRPRQVQIDTLLKIEEHWNNTDVIAVNLEVASGKCLAKGTKVLMFSGIQKNVEDILPGELVMGPDSKPRKVLNTCSGITDLYKIIPKRGESYIVTHNHILSVKQKEEIGTKSNRKWQTRVDNISVTDFLKQSNTYKKNAKQYQAIIDYPTKTVKVDPYIMGLWLGDGDSLNTVLTSMDQEIISAWTEEATRRGLSIRVESKESKANRYFVKTKGQRTAKNKNSLKIDIGSYGLFYNKHIPQDYLINSREVRLNLLAGLIDTDGYVNQKNASIVFYLCNERLIDDIIILARSLGFASSKTKNKLVDGTTYYGCTISGQNVSEIPTRLVRKRPTNSKSNQSNCSFDIEYAGKGEYAGFEVDGDALFVLGNFVVTHNSAIAMTLAKWAQKTFKQRSAILTPTNILVDQYVTDYPGLHTLKRQDSYCCSLTADHEDPLQRQSCKEVKENLGRTCKGCHYSQALKKTFVYPYGVYNYYTYLAYKIYPDILIVDEAHNLLPMIQAMAAKKYWHHQYNFPTWVNSYGKLKAWLEANPLLETDSKLQALYGELTSGKTRYLVQQDIEPYRGVDRPLLKLVPVDVRDQPPLLWPLGKVKKIILLSATINRTDIEELGLDKRRVRVISAPSPIPAKNRPIIVEPSINTSFRHQLTAIPQMAEKLTALLKKHPGEKGFVHIPYNAAILLRKALEGTSDRWLFHDKDDKAQAYQKFRDSDPALGKVLIASGMYEGVDLKEDIARWQVLAKVPWPSLAEPAISFKAEMNPEWYNWETAKQVIQAVGRVCRTPTDFGITYIWDSTFLRLYNENPELFSDSFKEAVEIHE